MTPLVRLLLTQRVGGEVTTLIGGSAVDELDVLQNIVGAQVVFDGHRGVKFRSETRRELGVRMVLRSLRCMRATVMMSLLGHSGMVRVAAVSTEYPAVVLTGVRVLSVRHVMFSFHVGRPLGTVVGRNL